MGYFPFFIDIKGKRGLGVGGGRIAAHKVEKLRPFGAKLTVIAPVIRKELTEDKSLVCLERDFADSDIREQFFVIAATDNRELNAHIGHICHEKGILVNVVDDKESCGFLFPALVKEGKLTVGISTEGASPQVAATVRSGVAQELPGRMEAILDYLESIREPAKQKIRDGERRAAFLKETADYCMEQNRPLSREETRERLETYASDIHTEHGKVILVGAGCGAYDLITLRGLGAVRSAQVLVYDDLLDERLLDHAAESCEKIYAGKRCGRHSMLQEEINALLVEKARQGKCVVRLKGGDPFVFGRGGEEMQTLREAGIEVQEIPGITSAIAVPAAAGIPVTHRGVSRSFHVITGHTAENGKEPYSELEAVAKSEGTCVFLMGFSHLKEIAEDVEKSIRKKFRKNIWCKFTKAINQYKLVQEGDSIAVCISGGKDSMLMAKLFQELKLHNKFPFEVKFLVMDPGYSPENRKIIEDNAAKLNIPITVFESDIFESVYHVENVNPDTVVGYKSKGVKYSFLDEYDNEE